MSDEQEQGSVWRHIRLGLWKNIETAEELQMPVCLDCGHTACPVCVTWCDVLDDEHMQCCDGDCRYPANLRTAITRAADNVVDRPHMCRHDRHNPLKRTVLVLLVFAVACGSSNAETADGVNGGADSDRTLQLIPGAAAGSDAGSDASTDAGSDAGSDAGADAGTDAGSDAGSDTGSDASTDAGSDAGSDAGTDAGADAGSDAGSDAGTDAAPPSPSCFGTVQAGACQCTGDPITSCVCEKACFTGPAVNTGVCCADAPALIPVCACS